MEIALHVFVGVVALLGLFFAVKVHRDYCDYTGVYSKESTPEPPKFDQTELSLQPVTVNLSNGIIEDAVVKEYLDYALTPPTSIADKPKRKASKKKKSSKKKVSKKKSKR